MLNIPVQEKSIIQGFLSTQLTLNFHGANQFTPTMVSKLQCIISTKFSPKIAIFVLTGTSMFLFSILLLYTKNYVVVTIRDEAKS